MSRLIPALARVWRTGNISPGPGYKIRLHHAEDKNLWGQVVNCCPTEGRLPRRWWYKMVHWDGSILRKLRSENRFLRFLTAIKRVTQFGLTTTSRVSYQLAGALELPEVRKLIAQIKQKIQLHPNNGTYTMRTWEQPEGPFQGPGW